MKKNRGLTYEGRLTWLALGAGGPGSLTALIILWTGGYTLKVQWTLTVLIGVLWMGFVFALRERIIRPLQTVSNLVAALREGDFSVRGRAPRADDTLGAVYAEVNALSDTLREQRLGALEANALLTQVMEEIDVAIFAFDSQQRLQLANRAAELLLGQPAGRLLKKTAAELGLAELLVDEASRTLPPGVPRVGHWELRRREFRLGGLPHQLVVLADVSRALREEERAAWQRLVRVLGHEINNSLTPIQSIASSLYGLAKEKTPSEEWREDLEHGLAVISRRSEGLARFMAAYARLSRLPPPSMGSVSVSAWVNRVVSLETRLPVRVRPGPEVTFTADNDQLEQLLINVVRNAVDAALQTSGGVEVRWRLNGGYLEVGVEDEGPGLPPSANLFVPFFTTKEGGSGIGLVLSRQIAEAHGGQLLLQDRPDRKGCRALLRLPLKSVA